MSHDQLPEKQRVDEQQLPSIDEVVKPEPGFQYQRDSGLSAQQEIRKKKRNRNMRIMLGLMGASVVIGGGGAAVVAATAGGNPEKTNDDPNVAGPVNTGEVINETPELPTTLQGANVMEAAQSGESAQGNFTYLFSKVVNERTNNGGEPIADDLKYMVSPEILPEVESFVDEYTSNLNEERAVATEGNYAGIVDLGIANGDVVSTPTANGSFEVQSTLEYWAVDSVSGERVGAVTGNIDTITFTYEPTTYELADGTTQESTVLVDMQKEVIAP